MSNDQPVSKPVNVTKTFLPPIEEYKEYLDRIWESGHITNKGPLLREFEDRVKDYLKISDFHFVTNGTLALQVALRALELTGSDIITTPFSYVATTSTILWEGGRPVFVDIDPNTLSIDVSKIEAAITENTKAILAVHVFGNPCDVEEIEAIAKKHGLKVIYDAAHAFGVTYKGKSLFEYGDVSTSSFHATKLFHTIEGGGVISKQKEVSDKVELLVRFGHHGDEHHMLGINAKASEFQAAMGLCNLKYVQELIDKRRTVSGWYDKLLGDRFQKPIIRKHTDYNYSYYPVLADNEEHLLRIMSDLSEKNIFPRRYFYPSLNTLPYLSEKQSCPISEDISNRVLCLPLYHDLSEEIVAKTTGVLLR